MPEEELTHARILRSKGDAAVNGVEFSYKLRSRYQTPDCAHQLQAQVSAAEGLRYILSRLANRGKAPRLAVGTHFQSEDDTNAWASKTSAPGIRAR